MFLEKLWENAFKMYMVNNHMDSNYKENLRGQKPTVIANRNSY